LTIKPLAKDDVPRLLRPQGQSCAKAVSGLRRKTSSVKNALEATAIKSFLKMFILEKSWRYVFL